MWGIIRIRRYQSKKWLNLRSKQSVPRESSSLYDCRRIEVFVQMDISKNQEKENKDEL